MSALDVDIRQKVFPASGGQPAHKAIENLRCHIEEREFVCILGPSGAGKTTTLNIIAGLDTHFDGSVAWSGDKGRLAYVFQTPRLLPWRTVIQNIELVIGPGDDRRATALALLDDVGLAGFANAYPSQISLGMQRRASLARAFALRPDLMLMDEPFVSLDDEAASALRALLINLWRAHPTTIVFVTHDTREAIRLATRILIFSPAPATLIRDIGVPLSSEDRMDPQVVEAFRVQHIAAMTAGSAAPGKVSLNGRSAKHL